MQPISELPSAPLMSTPSSVLPSAASPDAVVPMKLPLSWLSVDSSLMSTPLPLFPEMRLPCGGCTKTARSCPVGLLPPVASPPIRLLVDPAVIRMPLAALPRSIVPGHVRADIVHGDLVVVRASDFDAVAAVAADHVGQLEGDVDGRLEGNRGTCAEHDADHLVAVHGIGAGNARR